MTSVKKIISLILCASILCAALCLSSCNAGGGEADYSVTVKDALGNPYTSGIVVKFMQGGEQIAMQACDKNGTAVKKLARGTYTVELSFTDGEDAYHYNKGISLTKDETSADIIISKKLSGETTPLFVGMDEFAAYAVSVGCTYAQLAEGKMSYFLFTPTEAGMYDFSVAEGEGCTIGYYGAPHFVQTMSAAEVVDNKFKINVTASMIGTGSGGTSTLVIGVEAEDGKADCVLAIDRIGDAEKTIEDEPWSIYEKTVELTEYTLPNGYEIKEFDLTASTDEYKLVFNENDGFYHLDSADGPLVLVRLAEDCDYIACFKTMLDRSGVSRYYYNEDGSFDKKVSFSECLLEYIEYVDEAEGVYPLTEDLKHIICERGDYVGWWDAESSGYIFKDAANNIIPGINSDIAWLLMCCYVD